MSSREIKLVPFALGLLCGGVMVAFALKATKPEPRVQVDTEIANQEHVHAEWRALPGAHDLPVAQPARSVQADRVPIDSEVEPVLANALDQLPATIPTTEQLEQRYSDYSLPELIGARKGLHRVVHEESMAFIKKKMERGIYTTHVLPVGAPFSQDGKFPDGSPRASRQVWNHRGDGTAEVWIGDIHPKEQPILEARHAEIAWLSARVRKLEEAKKN